ncbi:MAG: NADH-quinone oxidoreductase subunit M, partial [Thiotrichales bacterium]
MFDKYLLSLLIWLPILGGCLILVMGHYDKTYKYRLTKYYALLFSLITFALCIRMYCLFNLNTYHMQFVEDYAWIPLLHARYTLGVDGISLLFIMLCSFTNIIIILAAWNKVLFKLPQYLAIFLIATGIMNGSFASTDALLFYVFWEASLIPMFIGIGVWGGSKRSFAAIKFFLYTFLGSIFLLLAFLYMYSKTGNFNLLSFQNLPLSQLSENLIFLAFFAAFAVKIPMFPVHTWLPDAHTEAPAGGSVVLAALMLKLGGYGFIRFSLPIVPRITESLDWVLIALSLVAIIYIGFATIVQKDIKRLIAYSSISHMGIVTLGLFMVFMIAATTHNINDATMSIQGALFQMVSHAFSSGALFIGVGYLYKRFHSRQISDYQGIATVMPVFAAFYMLFAMGNVGLPGTSGFVGEFLIIVSAFKANFWIALAAGLTLLLAPAYTLWLFKRVIFGTPKEGMIHPDIDYR